MRLAAKFLTKRVVNAEAVSRTFKPLWRLIGEMKIRDIGGNILLFEFDDALDLERVLELEPWTYDKSLVVFRRAVMLRLLLYYRLILSLSGFNSTTSQSNALLRRQAK